MGLTTIGRWRYASVSGRRTEIDSWSQFKMQSAFDRFAAAQVMQLWNKRLATWKGQNEIITKQNKEKEISEKA